MKNKKKICVVATIIATILLIHSCSKGHSEKTKAVKELDINTGYKEVRNKKEVKTKIDNLAVEKVKTKILADTPKEILKNKKIVSEKTITKENFYRSSKKESVKENIQEPIQSEKMGKIVTEKKESISTIEKIKENTILLFGNFNFFNRDHRAGYKKNKTVKPPEKPSRPIGEYKPLTPEVKPLRPIDKYDPLTPEVPVAVRPLPPVGILPDRPYPIVPVTPTLPKVVIWEDGKGVRGTSYTLTHDVTTSTNDGLRTEGGEIINEATIALNNDSYSGMKIGRDGSTGINKGIIDGGKAGMKVSVGGIITDGSGNSYLNDGTLIDWADGIATNDGIIKNSLSGMQVVHIGKIINNGTIENVEIGMEVSANGEAINNKIIKDSKTGMGVYNGGIATNNEIIENTEIGMAVFNNGTIVNNGIIDANNGKGMYATGQGTAINKKASIITNDSDGYGMIANDESTAINKGTININGKNGVFNSGMYVGHTGIATNEGVIIMNSGSGMKAQNKGTITNKEKGIIEINDRIFSNGMNVGKGTAINKGRISINSGNSSGMVAMDGGVITNEKIIDINNTNGIGMRAINTSTSTAINKGTININGDNGIGIEVTKGATGINDDLGIINLNANNGIGIKVDGVGSSYVNNGDINIASGTTGNQKIVLSGGATFSNSGSIVADGEFNTNQMGSGQFIMSDGGTLEAEKIKGDIYASGALAMGEYDDIYSTYKMLKTTNLEGDIISNSAMFDAHFTENKDENGFYDVVLDRKNFNTIVSNEKLGEILENNYEDNGNKLKEDYYDALKLVSTEKGLDKAVEDSYGMSYYPTLAKQTFEIVKDSNQVIVDQVLNNTKIRKTGETIAIAGVNTTKLKNDSYSNISGYDTDLYSVYLGAEKQLNKDTRIGGIITIGKADTDSKDIDGLREDYYYQGNIYYIYENDERLKFTSMIYGGITDTSLERTLTFGSLNETMKDNINNYYIGLNNELSKKYYFNRNYLKPKFELNFTYMSQDGISESGDQGLKIDGESSASIETGLGLALGRDFYMDNGSKANLEGSVTGYAELGNPYKDLNSTFETLSTDKVKIEGYNNDDFYGDIMIGGSYETNSSLKLFTKLGYRIGNDSNGFIGNIGMNYMF